MHPLQPVCWSKPISGDRMTPRISIMSVPGRTVQTVPPVSVTVTPATLSYDALAGAMPGRPRSAWFRTACVT